LSKVKTDYNEAENKDAIVENVNVGINKGAVQTMDIESFNKDEHLGPELHSNVPVAHQEYTSGKIEGMKLDVPSNSLTASVLEKSNSDFDEDELEEDFEDDEFYDGDYEESIEENLKLRSAIQAEPMQLEYQQMVASSTNNTNLEQNMIQKSVPDQKVPQSNLPLKIHEMKNSYSRPNTDRIHHEFYNEDNEESIKGNLKFRSSMQAEPMRYQSQHIVASSNRSDVGQNMIQESVPFHKVSEKNIPSKTQTIKNESSSSNKKQILDEFHNGDGDVSTEENLKLRLAIQAEPVGIQPDQMVVNVNKIDVDQNMIQKLVPIEKVPEFNLPKIQQMKSNSSSPNINQILAKYTNILKNEFNEGKFVNIQTQNKESPNKVVQASTEDINQKDMPKVRKTLPNEKEKVSNKKEVKSSNTTICHVCSKPYASAYLKKHMMLHTREPLICGECNESFDNKKKLNAHLKKIHRREDQ